MLRNISLSASNGWREGEHGKARFTATSILVLLLDYNIQYTPYKPVVQDLVSAVVLHESCVVVCSFHVCRTVLQ